MYSESLMIGDWVMLNPDLKEFYEFAGKPCQVIGLRDDDGAIKIEYDNGKYFWTDGEDDIIPIPLTIEVLEKNDFELEQKLTYWTYRILIDEETEHYLFLEFHFVRDYVKIIWQHASGHADSMIVVLNHCKVHQLQQALRLCGIPKEIEL